MKNNGGKPIRDEKDQKTRWVGHFEELLNGTAQQDPPDIPQAYKTYHSTAIHPLRQTVK